MYMSKVVWWEEFGQEELRKFVVYVLYMCVYFVYVKFKYIF